MRATPDSVRMNKVGQREVLKKSIDKEAYLKICDALMSFVEDGAGKSESNSQGIRVIKRGADGFDSTISGTFADAKPIVDEYKKHLGEREVDRFINKFLAEPIDSGDADRSPA